MVPENLKPKSHWPHDVVGFNMQHPFADKRFQYYMVGAEVLRIFLNILKAAYSIDRESDKKRRKLEYANKTPNYNFKDKFCS